MYKNRKSKVKTSIRINNATECVTIEEKVSRLLDNEPIRDGAPLVFTDRRNGVQPEFNIRTDRFEIAIDAMDKISADKIAKREEAIKTRTTTENGGNPSQDLKAD